MRMFSFGLSVYGGYPDQRDRIALAEIALTEFHSAKRRCWVSGLRIAALQARHAIAMSVSKARCAHENNAGYESAGRPIAQCSGSCSRELRDLEHGSESTPPAGLVSYSYQLAQS